jgi:hypothetical protein
MAMDLDDGGVDHGVFHVWRIRAGLEKPGEDVRFNPVAVTLENSVPVAEGRRKITPRASRPDNPKYRFNEAAIVASAASGVRRLPQTMRLHLRPLGICQYESLHLKLESQPSLRWNPESQQTLAHSFDGYSTNVPVADLVDGKAMIATHYDGKPLTPDHGGPARLLVPHLYFWKSAKWINGLQFTERDEAGFWELRGYHIYGDPWREQRYSGD